MRKVVSLLILGGLLLLPNAAVAGKKHGSFTAQAAPLPNLSSNTGTQERSCFAGVEGVHKVTKSFKANAKGKLTVHLTGFDGDWDLAVKVGSFTLYSVQEQAPLGSAPQSEKVIVPLKRGQKAQMSACNWAGGPEAVVHWTFVYR